MPGPIETFGAVLERLRRAQGFASPYTFYKKRGGRRTLGISFPNYLKIERGRSLPRPERINPMLGALGLEPSSSGARELARAYLLQLLGGEDLLRLAVPSAEPDPAPQSWLLAETAARQAIGQRAVQLSLDQYEVLARDERAYACHVVLANTGAWVEPEELARTLGRERSAVEAGLRALAGVQLVERSGTRARSPLAGKFVTPPAPTPALASVYAVLQRHRAAWTRDAGRVLHSPYLVLRAPRERFSRYLQHMTDVVNLSAVYGDVNPSADSEVYLVEGRVTRLFPVDTAAPAPSARPKPARKTR